MNLQGKKSIKIDIQAIESDNNSATESLINDFANKFAEEVKKRSTPFRQVPSISISVETDFECLPRENLKRPTNLIIPMLTIQTPSPTQEFKTPPVIQVNSSPGSPPPQTANDYTVDSNIAYSSSKKQQQK